MKIKDLNALTDKNNYIKFKKSTRNKLNNPVNKELRIKYRKRKKVKTKSPQNNITKDNRIENLGVSIIVIVNNDKEMEKIFSYYEKQTFRKKEMIIALNNANCDIKKWLNNSRKYSMIRVYLLDYLTHIKCIEYCKERSIYKWHIILDKNSKLSSKLNTHLKIKMIR